MRSVSMLATVALLLASSAVRAAMPEEVYQSRLELIGLSEKHRQIALRRSFDFFGEKKQPLHFEFAEIYGVDGTLRRHFIWEVDAKAFERFRNSDLGRKVCDNVPACEVYAYLRNKFVDRKTLDSYLESGEFRFVESSMLGWEAKCRLSIETVDEDTGGDAHPTGPRRIVTIRLSQGKLERLLPETKVFDQGAYDFDAWWDLKGSIVILIRHQAWLPGFFNLQKLVFLKVPEGFSCFNR